MAGRPRTLLLVPCDEHGAGPCPSAKGCANRRARAGLLPAASGTPGNKRPAARAAQAARLRRQIAAHETALVELRAQLARLEG